MYLLATILDFSQTFLLYYCHGKEKFVYNAWIFDILYLSILSHFVLKTKLYKHQYCSMIAITLLGFVLNVIYAINGNEIDYIDIFMKLISELFFCLNIVFTKYIMEKYFCSPYEICMWEGIINLFLFIICIFLFDRTILSLDYYNEFIFYVSLAMIFTSCFYNMTLLLTCEKLTPCHTLIIMIIHESYNYVQINDDFLLTCGIIIVILILIIFLFFIEIIELNIFEISRNTKKNIGKRADDDSYIKDDSSSDSSDLDDEKEKELDNTNILLDNTSRSISQIENP